MENFFEFGDVKDENIDQLNQDFERTSSALNSDTQISYIGDLKIWELAAIFVVTMFFTGNL
jgi:hypothetical protein